MKNMNEAIQAWTPYLVVGTLNKERDISSTKREELAVIDDYYGPVEAFTDYETIERVKRYFFEKEERYSSLKYRNYVLFVIGINIGRRCGDLRLFQFKHVWNFETNEPRDTLSFYEGKTNKPVKVHFNQSVKDAVRLYIDSRDDTKPDDYMFFNYKTGKALTTKGVYRFIHRAKTELGLTMALGTHSMRKTCASFMLRLAPEEMRPIALTLVSKEVLRHEQQKTSTRYLGHDQKEVKMMYEILNL